MVGAAISGTIGIQGHCANGLAALFIACGQDAACVAEAAIGNTAFLLREGGKLQVSVTLPNLIVGTVGGGTALPSQRSCLEILGMSGEGKARAFAKVAAALCLAGEMSITGALAAGEFCAGACAPRPRQRRLMTVKDSCSRWRHIWFDRTGVV